MFEHEQRQESWAVNAAFRAILNHDWPALTRLQAEYPHLLLDPGAAWTISQGETFRGVRGVLTWNAEETAYVVVCGLEQVARWIGYRIAEDDDLKVVWHGTIKLPCGHWAAQFTVESDDENSHAL